MNAESGSVESRLNSFLREAGLAPVDVELGSRFSAYCSLILRWNARINLTSIRDEEGILSRHFVESIACARALPQGIATLLDFGSGAGFPGIPIALCRPEIAVTLAESQARKAAFLQEAVRVTGISAKVYAGRAETLEARFGCVAMRAVDRMPNAVCSASALVSPGGWLALMTTSGEVERLKTAAGAGFSWSSAVALPGGEYRVLVLGVRTVSERA
jgi:16S rRNA (guanine527-N7)-methyltransferase